MQDKMINEIKEKCKSGVPDDTNELIVLCVKCLLKYNQIAEKIDFTEMIQRYFELNDDGSKWLLKDNI